MPSEPTKNVLFHVSRGGAELILSEAEFQRSRGEFSRNHALVLRGVIDASLLAYLQEQLSLQRFEHGRHEEISGSEMRLGAEYLNRSIQMMFNRAPVLRAIESVAGVDTLGCFVGRGYRMHASGEHFPVGTTTSGHTAR